MLVAGYGDIYGFGWVQQFSCLISMFVGFWLYNYSVSLLAATFSILNSPRASFLEKVNSIDDFIQSTELSPKLRANVHQHLKLSWMQYGGTWTPGSAPLLKDLPPVLQQDITVEDTMWLMQQVPMFKDTDESFLRALSVKLVLWTFTPNDFIVRAGNFGDHMYMIRRCATCIITVTIP